MSLFDLLGGFTQGTAEYVKAERDRRRELEDKELDYRIRALENYQKSPDFRSQDYALMHQDLMDLVQAGTGSRKLKKGKEGFFGAHEDLPVSQFFGGMVHGDHTKSVQGKTRELQANQDNLVKIMGIGSSAAGSGAAPQSGGTGQSAPPAAGGMPPLQGPMGPAQPGLIGEQQPMAGPMGQVQPGLIGEGLAPPPPPVPPQPLGDPVPEVLQPQANGQSGVSFRMGNAGSQMVEDTKAAQQPVPNANAFRSGPPPHPYSDEMIAAEAATSRSPGIMTPNEIAWRKANAQFDSDLAGYQAKAAMMRAVDMSEEDIRETTQQMFGRFPKPAGLQIKNATVNGQPTAITFDPGTGTVTDRATGMPIPDGAQVHIEGTQTPFVNRLVRDRSGRMINVWSSRQPNGQETVVEPTNVFGAPFVPPSVLIQTPDGQSFAMKPGGGGGGPAAGGGTGQTTIPIIDKATGRPVPPAPTAAQKETITKNEASISDIQDVRGLYKPEFVGPAMGRLLAAKQHLPNVEQDRQFAALAGNVATLRNTIINSISGAAVSPQEATRIMAQIPDVSNPPAVFEERLNASEQNLRMMLDIIRRKGALPSSKPFGSSNPPTKGGTINPPPSGAGPQRGDVKQAANGKKLYFDGTGWTDKPVLK